MAVVLALQIGTIPISLSTGCPFAARRNVFANIARARLRVDARKWLLSKLLPKVYGDKLALGGDADAPPIQIQRIERVIVKPGTDAGA